VKREKPEESDWRPRPSLFPQVCSASEEHLDRYISRLRQYLEKHTELPIQDVSGTMAVRYVPPAWS
jgi:hypothetical protein